MEGENAGGGFVRVLNDDVVQGLHIPAPVIDAVTAREREELARREHAYRDDRPPPDVQSKTVILVDDGLATGSTMRAAVRALRRCGAGRIVVAVPVSSMQACSELAPEVDEIVCPYRPEPFRGVGAWYEDFGQTTDQEVRDLLHRAAVLDQT